MNEADRDLEGMGDDERDLELQITLPLDGHKCLRRACPSCGLEFKQTADAADISGALAERVGPITRRPKRAPQSRSSVQTCCPYCARKSAPQAFTPESHLNYAQQVLFRAYFEPMLGKMFADALGANRKQGNMQVTFTKGPRRVRPMLGPEPNDMVRIRCLKCDHLFKVLASWRGSLHCPACATELLTL